MLAAEVNLMRTPVHEPIAILGLSRNPERYSYKANARLRAAGYTRLIGIHPQAGEVEGTPVVPAPDKVPPPIHTLTIYLSPELQHPLTNAIVALRPRRIIFNPGTENEELARLAHAAGIETLHACTLVLLATEEF